MKKLKRFIIVGSLALSLPLLAAQDPNNWLVGADFEQGSYSIWPGGTLVSPGHDSNHALSFHNDKPSWNQSTQDVDFGSSQPVSARLSGWVSTQGVVTGAQNYMQARLNIEFFDAQGNQVGGWPASTAQVSGDTGWTFYTDTYRVPQGAAKAQVSIGLGDCVGTAEFDDLDLQLLDAQGKPLHPAASKPQRTDTSGWYAFKPSKNPAGGALDLSFLNDKPAGTHGHVLAKDGHFVFQDGTRARFWGTDIVGPNVFMTHAQADVVARNLARLGVNLVRLHHMDAPWANPDIFDPQADNTQVFSKESLDRLDYLIAQLKKNGIYVYVDFMVHRKFRPGDGVADWRQVENGAKGIVQFDPRVEALNEKYARMLLSHVNPYTGLALKDDPVLLASEVVNESSIFTGFGEQDFPAHYEAELQALYEKQGGPGRLTRFAYDWDSHTLKAVKNPGNAAPSLAFLEKTEEAAYRSMRRVLEGIHSRGLLTGSNITLHVAPEIWCDAQMDYMDAHSYWDHPQVWKIHDDWAHISLAPILNQSQLTHPLDPGALIRQLSDWKVEGKPFIVTEWNDCYPDEYRAEGPLLMSAYGSLQDWDGMLQFDYALDQTGSVKMTPFDINTRPDDLALYQAAALIYRRAYLEPAPARVIQPVPVRDGLVAQNLNPDQDLYFTQPWLPYAVRLAKDFCPAGSCPKPDLAAVAALNDTAHHAIRSSSGQLSLDYGRGILTLDSPRARGWVGDLGGLDLKAGGLSARVSARDPWAALVLVSLDGKDLKDSGRMVLVAVARAENTGQVWNPWRTGLDQSGRTPVLMQGVEAGVTLLSSRRLTVRPLDSDGGTGAPLPSSSRANGLGFSISRAYRTSYYLVQAAQAAR